jgi:hypothetical protein
MSLAKIHIEIVLTAVVHKGEHLALRSPCPALVSHIYQDAI